MPHPNTWWLGAFQGRELKKFCNIIFVIKYFYKLVSIILFCHQCEKVFFSAFDPFWCETIYLSGQLKMSWKTMLLQMVCVQGQKYSCKLCGKDYSALMGLNIYKRNVHGIITWIKIFTILSQWINLGIFSRKLFRRIKLSPLKIMCYRCGKYAPPPVVYRKPK